MIKHLCAAAGAAGLAIAMSACSGTATSDRASLAAEIDSFTAPTVMMDGAKVAAYDAASPGAFAQTPLVTAVVTGTVTDVESVVYDDADVYTAVTIEVDSPEASEPRTIMTRELGGTVPLGEVREDFEGRVPDAVLDAHADDPVTYVQTEEPVHSEVGQQVAVFLGGSPTDYGGYFSAATMILSPTGSYEWQQDEAPNAEWRETLPANRVERIAASE